MDPEKGWFLSSEFPGRPAVQPPFFMETSIVWLRSNRPLARRGGEGPVAFLGSPERRTGKMNEWLLMVQKSGFNTWDVVESLVSNGRECHVNGINLSNYIQVDCWPQRNCKPWDELVNSQEFRGFPGISTCCRFIPSLEPIGSRVAPKFAIASNNHSFGLLKWIPQVIDIWMFPK